MKIIVDAMGGDNAPKEIVLGALDALKEKKSLHVVLVGDRAQIENALAGQTYDVARLEIVHASEVITNDDAPTAAVKTKKDSSVVKGLEMLASDADALGFVSAGATGAVLVAAYMKLGRIKGVSRPALAPALPTVKGTPVVLCDCGANVDCKPLNLLHFAIMASAFSCAMTGTVKPSVGLLSNGAEDKKGSELNREAFELLKASPYIDFKGNWGGLKAKLGALMLKPVLKEVKTRMDYNSQGGACFLGVNKVVVKAHGASKRKSICASILQARKLAKSGVVEKIRASVQATEDPSAADEQ